MNARSLLFTLYGDYVRHYGGEAWVGSLIALMEPLGAGPQAVRAAVSRMTRQGWLRSRRIGKRSFYSLSERGWHRVGEAARRIFALHPEPWDGRWRVLTYSLPEAHRGRRDALRRELQWLGFAPLAPGTWATPNDLRAAVRQTARARQIDGAIALFEGGLDGDARAFAVRHWRLPSLNERYRAFAEALAPRVRQFERAAADGGLAPRGAFVEKTRLVHAYRKFLFDDPGLPRELLPEPWWGHEARALFARGYAALAAAAVAFFESCFVAPPGGGADPAAARAAARRDPFEPRTAALR